MGREHGGHAHQPEAESRGCDSPRQMRRPLPAPRRQNAGLTMDEPAEGHGRSVADEGRRFGNQRVVRRRDAEPDDPVLPEVQRRDERKGKQDRSSPHRNGPAHRNVDNASNPAVAIAGNHNGPHRVEDGVQDQQVVEEPQMRQRESTGWRRRDLRRRRRDRSVERLRDAPDPHDCNRREEDDPAGHQRYEDSLEPVSPEAAPALTLDHHPGEEPRDKEEERHPEDVRRKQQDGNGAARRVVGHRPNARYEPRQKREPGVEDDAEEQRERADGVERVQAIGVRHKQLLTQSQRRVTGRRPQRTAPARPRRARGR